MSRCSQCLCVPAECDQCLVCKSQSCCASAHAGQPQQQQQSSRFSAFTQSTARAKSLFAAALGIEILCISFAELGENAGLYLFGLNPAGIAGAFALGYGLAGVATFVTILGRSRGALIDSGCCSVLEHGERKGFWPNLKGTLRDFAAGAKRLARIRNEQNLKGIVKSSVFILVTAESACILTAEVVGLALYQYSLLVSVPLALVAGAFAIVAVQYFKKKKK